MTLRDLRTLLRRILTPPAVLVAAMWLFAEEYLWVHLANLVARLARLPAIAALERRIAALPPYAAMALFGIPTALIFPIKLFALYLIGTGHALLGCIVILLAKGGGTAIVARLFAICRPKLMTIAWFARLYGWVMRVRDDLYDRVRRMPAWQRARALVQTATARCRRLVRGLGSWFQRDAS